ncbi:M28 family metallopeptidase [Verrucomicrobia bacterium]|nr:M28 family metallopeptidase [Verrucomicrobiota bacterium]
MRFTIYLHALSLRVLVSFISLACLAEEHFTPDHLASTYRDSAESLIRKALDSDHGFERLAEMCDRFGPRFSGSATLEQAIDWALEEMEKDGFSKVRGEPVMVPRWVRGKESLSIISPLEKSCRMLGLGGSVGTGPDGIVAEVLVVQSFEELKANQVQAKGKIVLFNAPFTDYGATVVFRVRGAIEAAKAGAVASLIRSVGPFSMQTPHTGMMVYDDAVPRIPHAAITLEDAMLLERMQERGGLLKVKLYMEAQNMEPSLSRNVVAEIPGLESPEEIVLISGHIDSWDVGQGAMDDGGGCLAMWEAARLILKAGLRPRRTIRVVLWTNEENGMAGVRTYRDQHKEALEHHVLAIESDAGTFKPQGFSFTGSEKAMPYLEAIGTLLGPVEAQRLKWGAGVSDIMRLVPDGVPVMGLDVDRTKYFWYHHTDADTIDKLDVKEFNQCVAASAVMTWIVADMPLSLPR